MTNMQVNHVIEAPFKYRHCCWFCGEPGNHFFTFPDTSENFINCSHPKLSLSSCDECKAIASKNAVASIWHVRSLVKKQLIKRYKKDLSIGNNWTKEELANSEFEGGSFDGFQKSAWFMYEVAKQRVNFSGWPLILEGLLIEDNQSVTSFYFDGIEYPSIDEAIEHYVHCYRLSSHLLMDVLAKVGVKRFSFAIRFCRLLVGATPSECQFALKELS